MPFLKNLSVIARKKKSHENLATQEGNIQAVSIIFMGQFHHLHQTLVAALFLSREAFLCATERCS
jgi:hypothetical protein